MPDALFAVDPEARTVSGLLVPFGELSRPSISGEPPVMFSAASELDMPADPMVATLYDDDHNRFEPRGRGVRFERTDAGIVATFAVARTPEGDALLERAQREPKPRLSAEIKGLVRRGQEAIRGAITGASVTDNGAFASAALFSAVGDVIEEPAPTTEQNAQAGGASSPAGVSNVLNDTTPDPSTTTQNPEESETPDMGNIVPGGAQNPPALTANGLFAAVAQARTSPEALKPYAAGSALFAIAPINQSGPSGATIGQDTEQVRYLGELWQRQPYRRRFVPLLATETLTSHKAVGWKWDYDNGKNPQVGDYAGNTQEVPSNPVDTVQVSVDAQRIAGGHKIDRRYVDFNDQAVIASYFREQTEDVARKTDLKALATIVANATALDVTGLPAPSADPDTVAPGLVAVVDAALQVIGTENIPSYGLVAPELWREIILRPKDATLEYLRAAFGLEDGEVANFRLLPANVGAGKVIVGAREAITWYELGGESPIRVEGIDPHHGAIDPAVFAYWAAIANNKLAVVSVDVATYGTAGAGA
jgi:hypothetical protein